MKTLKNCYDRFTRKSGPQSDISELVVPQLLVSNVIVSNLVSWNPFAYASEVNNLEMCDYVDGQLIVNSEKTIEERRRLMERSPAVMGLVIESRPIVFFRVVRDGRLEYCQLNGEIIQPNRDDDYVLRADVAAGYLYLDHKDFADLGRRGEFGIYGHEMTSLKKGKIARRTLVTTFLLSELNRYKIKH